MLCTKHRRSCSGPSGDAHPLSRVLGVAAEARTVPPSDLGWKDAILRRVRASGKSDRVRMTPMSWMEVTELVTQAQAGDRCAFGELVTRFEGAVFAAALTRLRNYVEAQELTQE